MEALDRQVRLRHISRCRRCQRRRPMPSTGMLAETRCRRGDRVRRALEIATLDTAFKRGTAGMFTT
ncbi:MAG: hypothetical protein ACLTSX_03055 [Collinsella sp.]